MLEILDRARRYLWAFVELGFLFVLALILIYLILGEGSGSFVVSVANNVTKFAGQVPTASLLGIGVLLAVIYLAMRQLPQPIPPARRPRASKNED